MPVTNPPPLFNKRNSRGSYFFARGGDVGGGGYAVASLYLNAADNFLPYFNGNTFGGYVTLNGTLAPEAYGAARRSHGGPVNGYGGAGGNAAGANSKSYGGDIYFKGGLGGQVVDPTSKSYGGKIKLYAGDGGGGNYEYGGDVILKKGAGNVADGNFFLKTLPTTDPGIADALWNNQGTVVVSGGGGGGNLRNDIAFNFSGVPGNAQRFTFIAVRDFTLPINLGNSEAVIGTNPTATLAVDLNKNGVSIGSVSFSTGGVPTFTFAAAVSFTAGDILTAVCPNPADATGADIAITLYGNSP